MEFEKATSESKVKEAKNALIPSYTFMIVKWDLQDKLHRNPSNPRIESGQVPIAPLLASWQIVPLVNPRQWLVPQRTVCI